MELETVKLARGSVPVSFPCTISDNLNAMMTVSFLILHISIYNTKNKTVRNPALSKTDYRRY
jgi:hypothetical protein